MTSHMTHQRVLIEMLTPHMQNCSSIYRLTILLYQNSSLVQSFQEVK